MNPLYLLIALTTLMHVAFVGSRLAISLYAIHLQASPATIGMLGALIAIPGVLSSVAVGRWIDSKGPRQPMLLSTIMMTAGCVLAFIWRDLAALFIVSAVVGAAYNMFFVANQQLIGLYGSPKDRVRNISLAAQGFAVGNLTGPLIAGFAIDGFGHPVALLLLAAAPLFPALIVGLDKLKFPAAATVHRRGVGQSGMGSLMELLRMNDLRRVYIMSLIFQASWNLYVFLMPIFGTQIGLSASSIGLVLGSFSMASISVRAFVPLISRRFTSWQLLLISFVMSSLSLIAIPFCESQAPLMALSFWLGMGMGVCGPIAIALVHEASPPERIGEVVGLRITMVSATQATVPLVAGALSATLGMGPMFLVLAASLIIGSYSARRQWNAHKS